jgi:hypothetical protein
MSDIEKVAVFDDRIVQTKPKYAVEKGAVSLTNVPTNAISETSSQHTYQIQVPSENVFVDRAIDWSSTCFLNLKWKMTSASATAPFQPAVDTPLLVLGSSVALSAFPLTSLVQTISATINDTTVTLNTGDVLKELLRLTDNIKNRSLRSCPTALDTYANYNKAIGANNNPLGSYSQSVNSDSVPNGAYPNIEWTNPDGAVLVGNGYYVDPDITTAENRVYYINGVPVFKASDSTNSFDWIQNGTVNLYLKFSSIEKLVVSPFIFSDIHENEVGLFGLQNIQLVMNMASPSVSNNVGRVLRFAEDLTYTAATSTNPKCTWSIASVNYNSRLPKPFTSSKVNVQFLTPSLDLPLPPKSIVNYFEYPRYVTVSPSSNWSGGKQLINSSTISLPCIPDLLIIYAKPSSFQVSDADYYLPVEKISINFDNFSGILSSHTQNQLYNISRNNGLDMSYEQWVGKAYNTSGKVDLTGGFLVLKPSKDITLSTGQAPSLIGNFTFQFDITVLQNNNYSGDVNLWVITANSGFFESQRGSSRIIKGVLNEKDIIDAPLSSLSTRTSINRAVGGASFKNMFGNAISKVQEYLPIARNVGSTIAPLVSQYGGDYGKKASNYANTANNLLKNVGLGRGSLQSRLM